MLAEQHSSANITIACFIISPFEYSFILQACQVEGKEEGQGEGGWIWQEKIWKGLELRKETKSTGRSGKYFRAVATPNKEKPKEEEEEEELQASRWLNL